MNTNTLATQSYRNILPAIGKEMRAVGSIFAEVNSAAVISIADKTEQLNEPGKSAGAKSWVMPPIVYAYMKGRDNDPL